MTKLAAVIAVLLATGCAMEAAGPAAAEPDAGPSDAPGHPDATPPPEDAADAPAVDSGAPDAPAETAPEAEACVPDPNVCGHTCAASDGCGFPIECSTCFGGCPVKPGDGVVCPAGENQVQCPTGHPTSTACTLGARDSSSEFWCCPR